MNHNPTAGKVPGGRAIRWMRQHLVALAVLCVGTLLSWGLFLELRGREREDLQHVFLKDVQDRVSAIKRTMELDAMIVESVGGLYAASNEVERGEFRVFAVPLLASRSSLRALEWVPRVPESKRSEYEAAARKDGFADFRIAEYDEKGLLVPASRRENYYPVFFREVRTEKLRSMGCDLGAEPQCREAMDRSASTGQLASTSRMVSRESGQFGLRLFLPVYRKNAPLGTVEDRRKNLDGFVAGVLRARGIVEEGLSALSPGGLHVAVLDLSAPEGQRLLVWHSARAGGSEFAPDDPETFCLESPMGRLAVIEMGGRQWGIACVPAAEFIAKHITWRPWAGALGALVITGLLATHLVSMSIRNTQATRLAIQLAAANRQWEDEFAERQRAETSLRTSQTKYRALYESSSDAIILATPQAGFLSGNHAAIALFGCRDEGDFVSHTPADLSPESQPDGAPSSAKAQQMMAIALQEGSHFFEWKHKRVDGSEFPATVLLTRMELDGKVVLHAAVRDITRQKRAEDLQRQLIAILEATPDIVGFASAEDQRILYMNKAGREMLRIGLDEDVTRLKISDVHPDWTNATLFNEALPAAARDGVWKGECAFRSRDGRDIPVMMVLMCHKSSGGGVEVFSTISRDISERKRAEQELRSYANALQSANRTLEESRLAAEAADRAKSAFLANMSHEIRSPMTAILGYTDLLADPTLTPSARNNYLAVVRRNGEHLLHLINDLLDLSKIEAGKLALDVQPCSLVSVLADVASMMRPRAGERSDSLVVEYAGELPETVRTDGPRLRQALVNLVGNAVKFTEKGSVRIRVAFLPEWRGAGPAVKIEVIDTGIGIRAEVLPQLFQPFNQGDASVSGRFGGTGLGLAISRHIAELLGGELTVQSTFGQGSTFALTFPTGELDGIRLLQFPAEAMEDSAPEPGLSTGKELAGVRVLLAEDGSDNQELIRTVLGMAGAEVEIAENGRVALAKAEAGLFDVILMDMNMPEMDGAEATRILRDRGYSQPILALTASAMPGDAEQSLAAGCDDHLTKPIDRVRLIRTIAEYVARASAAGDRALPSGGEARDRPGADAEEALVSQFADDPDIAAILERFVAGLDAQVRAMHEAMAGHRYEDLRRAAHRMKGAGGSYGYPALTDAARALEDAATNEDPAGAASALERLTALCQAIEKGRDRYARSGKGEP
jgi:PAS domain S-box-containing protein